MRYIWKFLSLISAIVLLVFAIPAGLIMRLHMWLMKKANPDYDPFRDALEKMLARGSMMNTKIKEPQDPEEMGKTIAEMMKAMHPDIVNGAKEVVGKTLKAHCSHAWSSCDANTPAVNPVPPRIPNLPAASTFDQTKKQWA